MPSETLLPCPFCGGRAEAEESPIYVAWGVRCTDCGVEVGGEDETDAIAAWNRRAAHQERDAGARRLDWMRDHYARFVYETTEIVDGRAVNLRTRIEWTTFGDGEPRTVRTVARTFTGDFRAAIDAAMAADTQTEGESDG